MPKKTKIGRGSPRHT